MRALSSAVLVAFAFPLAAQGVTWGLTGGATLGNLGQGGGIGWNAGIAIGPSAPLERLGLRIDLSYTDFGYYGFSGNNPGGGTSSSPWRSDDVGASADVTWNVLGAGKTSGPYLLAGAGWYAVRTVTSLPSEVPTTSVSGRLSYNAGLGIRFSRFFLEARALVIHDSNQPMSSGSNLHTYPVTLGVWF